MTAKMLLRSWLYVPAHDERKLLRAQSVGADVVVIDLEDGTPSEAKQAGRECAASVLAGGDFGESLRFVRIQSFDAAASWREDIEATIAGDPDGYLLPKVSSVESVCAVADIVRHLAPGESPDLAIIGTENSTGFFALRDSVVADPLVMALLWGSEDLAADIGARQVKNDDGQFLDVFATVRSWSVLTAAAACVPAIDTPFLDLQDQEALHVEACAASMMGFAGKQAIHPDQVPVIHSAFTPTNVEVARAEEIVAAFDAVGGDGALRVGGAMVDAPHLRMARHVLRLSEAARGRP